MTENAPDAESVIDTRGYSCPQPKFMICEILIHRRPPKAIALIDDYSSLDDVLRLAPKYGYRVECVDEGDWKKMEFRRAKQA